MSEVESYETALRMVHLVRKDMSKISPPIVKQLAAFVHQAFTETSKDEKEVANDCCPDG